MTRCSAFSALISAFWFLTYTPAFCQSDAPERPWIDISKYPFDVREMDAAGVTGSAEQPQKHLFILVRGSLRSDAISTSEGPSVLVAMTKKAEVQIGNAMTVHTFHVQGPLSLCYASSDEIGCIVAGKGEDWVITGKALGGR